MIVLTRPLPASRRFARSLRAAGMTAPILFSPVLGIEPFPGPGLPEGVTVIFTSENGVHAAALLGPLAGRRAVAVGERTASVARGYGMEAEALGGDAGALAARLTQRGGGPYLHLHGLHVTSDLAGSLRAAGIAAEARAIYDQRALPLTGAARQGIAKGAIVPLFSPRSAEIVAEGAGRGARNATIVALSAKVLDSWPWKDRALVAKATDAASMVDATVATWRARGQDGRGGT